MLINSLFNDLHHYNFKTVQLVANQNVENLQLCYLNIWDIKFHPKDETYELVY